MMTKTLYGEPVAQVILGITVQYLPNLFAVPKDINAQESN